jgi:hypothetical protein
LQLAVLPLQFGWVPMLQSGLVMQSAWQGLVVPPGGSQQQQPYL